MIDFSTVQEITIPEGVVTEIADAQGRVLWSYGVPVVLEVEKQTLTTYAGETEYENEEFILLDIYPKNANSTVNVTYGGLTKTLKFSGTNAQQIYFGTFNGVSDSVETPASGTLTIEGGCVGFACGTYTAISGKTNNAHCGCITNVNSWGIVDYIPHYAFYQCTNLALTELPSGITSIGNYAFSRCTNLALTELPSGITSIGNYAFSRCTLSTNIILNNVSYIGNYAFESTPVDVTITINGLPTHIGENAFNAYDTNDYDKIRNIYINDDNWNWDKWAEMGNPPFTHHYQEEGYVAVQEFDYYVYINGVLTSNIQSVNLNSCTSISSRTFYGFKSLTSITIPNSVVSIGTNAFIKAPLKQITVLAETPPTMTEGVFSNGNVVSIIVPKGCGEAYKSAEGWSSYADKIVEVSE